MSYIEVNNLTIRFLVNQRSSLGSVLFNKKIKRAAIKKLSLRIDENERVGILGRNGSGKSTLLKAISGIYAPHQGEIKVSGYLLPLLELGAGFDRDRTVVENIFLNGAILGLPYKQVKALVEPIIDFAELDEHRGQVLKDLSSGMKRRLGFSIAANLKPEILILDEVFAAGDVGFIDKAKKRIFEMADACKIVVIVSHSEEIIREMCNRVVVIDGGTLLFDGSVEDGLRYYNGLFEPSVETALKKVANEGF